MNTDENGKLYLVATPIGNLGDMSPRAIEVLKAADIIAAEDTRNTIKLLNHFDIKTPLTSYHEYNRIDKAIELIERMREGRTVALVTDAGMPGISDPGEDIVRIASEGGIEVVIVPGPCAAVSALAVSGLKTRRFVFEGFLPTEKKELKAVIDDLKTQLRTTIIYEAPHRIVKTLSFLYEELGDRKISLVRELTKVHEETIRTTLAEAVKYYEVNEPRGEYVLVIEGADENLIKEEAAAKWDEITIPEHVEIYVKQGLDKKEAMKKAAADRGISKRDIYKACVKDDE